MVLRLLLFFPVYSSGPSDAALLRSRELTRSQSKNPPTGDCPALLPFDDELPTHLLTFILVSTIDIPTEQPANSPEDEEVNVLDIDADYDHKYPVCG